MGDELRARFLPLLRGIMGEALYDWPCPVSHEMRSFGVTSCWSSLCWGAPMRSCHANLLPEVPELLSASGRDTSPAEVDLSSSSCSVTFSLSDGVSAVFDLATGAKLKAFNLFLVVSETGSSGLAGLLRVAVGLTVEWLFDLLHCGRFYTLIRNVSYTHCAPLSQKV